MRVFIKVMVLLLITLMTACQKDKVSKVFTESDIAIIPKPAQLLLEQGNFQFNENTQFVIVDACQKEIVSILFDKFKKAAGWTLETSEEAPENNFVQLVIDENMADEAYKLEANSEWVIITSRKF